MNLILNIFSKPLYTGTNWSWTEYIPGYTAPDFSLILLFKQGANPPIEITSQAAGDSFSFDVPKERNESLPGGEYSFQYIASSSGGLEVIASGRIEINTLLNSANCDLRGKWEKLLEKLWKAYELAAERGWAELEIDGDTVRYTRETLLSEIKYAEAKVAQEKRISSGNTYPRIHKIRLSR